MSQSWQGPEEPAPRPLTLMGLLRAMARGLPMAILVFGGAVLLVLLRLIERPIFGIQRPWTPHLTRFACRNALRLLGLTLHVRGQPMLHRGALVANHSTWLDIFTLNASDLVYFVSKAEVSGWPGIGWLARITGTVFIERDRRKAAEQTKLFETRLLAGHKLLFFPEGTSTDGQQVLPFKTTLFAAFQSDALVEAIWVQPVSVKYHAPAGEPARYYGWWGEMDFASNLLTMLATPRHGHVEVTYHAPLPAQNYPNRKALAAAAETAVRSAFEADSQQAQAYSTAL